MCNERTLKKCEFARSLVGGSTTTSRTHVRKFEPISLYVKICFSCVASVARRSSQSPRARNRAREQSDGWLLIPVPAGSSAN